LAIQALMLDVDGVLVDGRPDDGRHWLTSIEADLGVSAEALHEHFFAPCWEDIVCGRAALMDHLAPALRAIAPHLSPASFCEYWFAKDSRLALPLLSELASVRSKGIQVFLATNQEHVRAAHLMNDLGLAGHVDGMFYSAQLGAKKPDREFFAKVDAVVGLPPDTLLLIDDSRPNIDAALEAGWRAFHWTRQSTPDILRHLCA
jgi:putative hydrolase of the HAD superfamily